MPKNRTRRRFNSILEYLESDEPERHRKVFEQEYRVSSWAYFNRSYNMLPRSSENFEILFYCALELRCAIERVLYEYLFHLRAEPLTKGERKLWSARDLKSAIFQIEPDFIPKIKFLNLLIETRGSGETFELPDLPRLSADYGRLNDYLHAHRGDGSQLIDPEWWDELRHLIEDLHDYAWSYCSGWKLRIQLDELAVPLFEQFKRGEVTEKELKAILLTQEPTPNIDVSLRRYFY